MRKLPKLLLSLETDPIKMCELLVGLPDVTVLGVKPNEIILACGDANTYVSKIKF